MLRNVLRKIKNKAGLNLCLFLGMLLLIGVFACHPLMQRGGESKLLQKLFEDYITENGEYPTVFTRKWTIERESDTELKDIYSDMDAYRDKWQEYVDIDIVNEQYLYRYDFSRASLKVGTNGISIGVWGGNDIFNHMEAVAGKLDDNEITTINGEKWYPCVISEATADNEKIYVGAQLTYKQVKNTAGTPLNLYVAGVYKRKDYSDEYWMEAVDMISAAFVSDEVYDEIGKNFLDINRVLCNEHIYLDYTQITPDNAEKYQSYVEQFASVDSKFLSPLNSLLKTYLRQARSASMILFALELPCIILMIMFIYMVLSRILASEETEISVWRSRGFKRRQILWMYILQIILVGIPAYIAGIALGFGLCLLGASTNSFLSFVSKDISSYQMSFWAYVYGAVAVVLIILFAAIPIWIKSGRTIVDVKRTNKYSGKKNFIDKFFVDVLLLIGSIYLLVNFEKQKESIVSGILAGKSQDPLIFLNASLFILACGLITLRISRYLISFIYFLGRKRFGAAAYAACLQTKRTYEASRILAVFLVMTIASGLFDASLASAINKANEERIGYDIGTDIRSTEEWKKKTYFLDEQKVIRYIEPDFERYVRLAEETGIDNFTKVILDKRTSSKYKRTVTDDCTFMGIITDEFGKTARLKDGINDEHWYNALNALAAVPDGVIISENLAEKLDVNVGMIITYTRYLSDTDKEGISTEGKIVAIVDGFPGYEKYTYSENNEGGLEEHEKYLIAGNYAYAVSKFSQTPYEVWYFTDTNLNRDEFTKLLGSENITCSSISLCDEEIEKAQSGAIIQILNGIFTISFILCSVITVIGFLIYWVVSIKSRELLFGVYRAMGMHIGEIGVLIATEIFFCSVLPAFSAIGIGILASVFYSQLPAYVCMPQRHTIALNIGFETDRLFALGIGILIIILICMLVIRQVIRRMNIAQALKLGED